MAVLCETERLRIRRFRADDWPALFLLQGDAEATRFIGGVWSDERTQEIAARISAGYDTNVWEWFAVADRATDIVLGVCWLGPLNAKWCEALGIGPEIELGYRYARKYWGQGYATEAGRAMLARGFEELGLSHVVAIVDARNGASERVMQKLGMRHFGDTERDGVQIRASRAHRRG
jgi:RimJ/RimL family protein N-acetyltransferase